MANKTIPQLPEQTGKTDNDLLAIVDSGETVTSKIKVSTLLSGVGGAFQSGDATNSIVPSYSPTSRGVSTNTLYIDNLDTVSAGSVRFGASTVIQSRSNSYASFGQSGGNNTTLSLLAGGAGINNSGARSVVGSGFGTNNSGFGSAIWSYGCVNSASQGGAIGGLNHTIGSSATRSAVIGGDDNDITNVDSVAVGGNNNSLGHVNTVMLGCSGRTSSNDYYTYVESLEAFTHIVLNDYSNLNFASDAAAATGGVPLGGVYHNAGAVRVRIT